ncbi:MAG: hypothetical protein ACYC56_13190 [Candidatus Aquicultor sp.]
MAVAKSKEPPETKVEEPETKPEGEEVVKKSELFEAVKEVLEKILPGKSEETEVEEEKEPPKRMTARDEEEHTRGIVQKAIEDFLAKAPEEKKEEKKATEEAPGTKHVRKVEGWIWGKS